MAIHYVVRSVGSRLYSRWGSRNVSVFINRCSLPCIKKMAQILDPIPSDSSRPILCCYVNATSKIQVARITNVEDWYFERVVFPGQRLIFEAPPNALLEIHTGMMASAILSDSIPCNRLQIDQDEFHKPAGSPNSPPTSSSLSKTTDDEQESVVVAQ